MLQMKTFPLGAYQTNCYVLWNEGCDKCLVIDPGYEPDYILTQLRLLGKQVAAILLLPRILNSSDGVWFSIVAAELLALAVTGWFFVKKREQYHYA